MTQETTVPCGWLRGVRSDCGKISNRVAGQNCLWSKVPKCEVRGADLSAPLPLSQTHLPLLVRQMLDTHAYSFLSSLAYDLATK